MKRHFLDEILEDRQTVATELDNAAKQLERRAAELRRSADQTRLSDAEIKKWRKRLKQIPERYQRAVRAKANDPVGRVADELETSRESVEWYMERESDERRNSERNRRNRQMARLAAQGVTNVEIAKRFGVHRNTVQRAVAAAFKMRPSRSRLKNASPDRQNSTGQ